MLYCSNPNCIFGFKNCERKAYPFGVGDEKFFGGNPAPTNETECEDFLPLVKGIKE
jgi:hypothetical protein